ncbi:hypothetical protein F2Q68_00036041 [Brassica cretica]|uniref:Ribosomal protein L30 N-terminal domain-containing protein n=1 Tax=Brassica cretica TaxID=69181 RepID=A0A8S9GY86_BRACR|nr:hypothetical protein F2Q68_00036041 [Brassica cretica]
MAESKVVVPESVLKKRKREEEWALAKKQSAEAAKKTNAANRKLIYKRAEQYAKEYAEKEKELISLKREAKLKGGFYVDPEAKLLFIIRIRGINAIDPKTKKILQLLRLRQVCLHFFLLEELEDVPMQQPVVTHKASVQLRKPIIKLNFTSLSMTNAKNLRAC